MHSDGKHPVLNEEEQEAMDKLREAMNIIWGWGLRGYRPDLESARHLIQSYITHHMLERLAPAYWPDWYER